MDSVKKFIDRDDFKDIQHLVYRDVILYIYKDFDLYTYNEKFVRECVLNLQYFLWVGSSYEAYTVLYELLSTMGDSLSVECYDTLYELLTSPGVKNVREEFRRYIPVKIGCLNQLKSYIKNIDKIEKLAVHESGLRGHFNARHLKELDEDELSTFLNQDLSYINFTIHDTKYMWEIAGRDVEQCFNLAKKFRNIGMLPDMLYGASGQEIHDAVDKVQVSAPFLTWFEYHPDEEVQDKVIDIILSSGNEREQDYKMQRVAKNLTREQIEKYKSSITFETATMSENISPKEVYDLYGRRGCLNICFNRFYTEEEIREAPELFNPEGIVSTPSLYVSEEVFNELNKTWNKRVIWKDFCTDFGVILHTMGHRNINTDALKYLKDKTKINNKEFLENIAKLRIGEMLTKGLESPIILKNFYERYK